MATQTRKRPTKQRSAAPLKRRRQAAPNRRVKKSARPVGKFVLPFFLSFCILVCLAAMGFLGYRTVTASDFFNVASIDIRGVERSSKKEIERIVAAQTEKTGVWNADLPAIKERLEKLAFVKTAAVSRVLPNGIRVNVDERMPQAVVRLGSGDVLVDADGNVLAASEKEEKQLPFVMVGWDEEKSERAGRDNVERVKAYQKMLAEWQQFDLASRVRVVNLADLREPRAITEDSGTTVSIALGKDNYGENLKMGIKAIVGKGNMFEAVNLVGHNMILAPRKMQ